MAELLETPYCRTLSPFAHRGRAATCKFTILHFDFFEASKEFAFAHRAPETVNRAVDHILVGPGTIVFGAVSPRERPYHPLCVRKGTESQEAAADQEESFAHDVKDEFEIWN